MALIKCKECGGEVSTKAKACPKCGAKVPRTKWWLWVPLGGFAVFVLGGMMLSANDPASGAKSTARSVIQLCWEDQRTKSNTPSLARAVASMCEGMERDFKAKYNTSP